VVRGSPVVIFSGLLVFMVISIVVSIVGSCIKKLSSLSSVMSVVDFVCGFGSLAIEAMTGGSRLSYHYSQSSSSLAALSASSFLSASSSRWQFDL